MTVFIYNAAEEAERPKKGFLMMNDSEKILERSNSCFFRAAAPALAPKVAVLIISGVSNLLVSNVLHQTFFSIQFTKSSFDSFFVLKFLRALTKVLTSSM